MFDSNKDCPGCNEIGWKKCIHELIHNMTLQCADKCNAYDKHNTYYPCRMYQAGNLQLCIGKERCDDSQCFLRGNQMKEDNNVKWNLNTCHKEPECDRENCNPGDNMQCTEQIESMRDQFKPISKQRSSMKTKDGPFTWWGTYLVKCKLYSFGKVLNDVRNCDKIAWYDACIKGMS